MPRINPKGSPDAPVWVAIDKPLKGDADKGFVYSGGVGYVFDKMMKDAGLNNYYVKSFIFDTDHPDSWEATENFFCDTSGNGYAPPIIIPVGVAGTQFCRELIPKRQGKDYDEEEDSEIYKYAGSILTSPRVNFPHYVIPTLYPLDVCAQWKLRDEVVNLELGKAKAELDYWREHGILQPLPERICKQDWDSFDELLFDILNMRNVFVVSNDIETVYPREKSIWKGLHPGYPITIGLASSSNFGISFDLFRNSKIETRELWRVMNELFKETIQLGQNFFHFDIWFYQMLGFEIKPEKVIDTIIRHHVLWPELPHKLQFLTKQYTRQPYYKDEGHGWGIKNMRGLKHYNCLDVCITREVYDAQEEEFKERPWLK